nr:uncharacterized protein LOC109422126 [Aedes albopictus]XP_019552304.2 uncharacterized protein LOC109422126 [Aedes albopictus]
MDDLAALERRILTIVNKTDRGFKCQAIPNCIYTQSVNRFNVDNFSRHLEAFHPEKYRTLVLGKEEVAEKKHPTVSTRIQKQESRHPAVMRGKIQKVSKVKGFIKNKLLAIVKKTDFDYVCTLGGDCNYKQPLMKFNAGNFLRHMMTHHPADCIRLDLRRLDTEDPPPAVKPDEEHVTTKVSKFRFLCGMVRLVTTHGLPLDCVSWQGMEDIIMPQVRTFKMYPMDEAKMRDIVDRTANQMQKMICEGMNGRMVALQLHGTMSRDGQYVVRVTCSFMREDSHICRQTLGVIFLDETTTCLDLEDKVNRIKERCGLEQWQIYTISIDNGRVNLNPEPVPEEHTNETDDSKFVEILDQYNASLTDANVLQCGRHMLSMVATEATQECADVVEEIVEMVKSFRLEEHKTYIQSWQGQYPNIPDKSNYGFGTYFMMKALMDDRAFYEEFTVKCPGLALYLHWDFIEEFVTAFEPLYDCANRIASCGLSDFHLQWLLAYGRVRRLPINRFKNSILKSMEERQRMLEDLAPYKAALYMDPRLNFRGSKLFDNSKKEKIVTFLHSIYTMTEDTSDEDRQSCPASSSSTYDQSQDDFSMNDYLTEMLGEGSPESVMEELIREIQQQERCDADDRDFDVVKYWAQKKMYDARLWTLARAVFAPLATHCGDADDDIGRGLSSVSKVIKTEEGCPPQQQQLDDGESFTSGESSAGNALFVKQNPNLLERAILRVFFKDKSQEMEDDM